MFRRSSNNPWVPAGGINSGYFGTIGGADAGSLDNRFPGQLGQTVVHSNKTALQDSKTTVGTLFEGVYQLVKFSSAVVGTTGFAGTVKRGSLVFWDTLANNGIQTFQVTDVATAAGNFRAGIVINADTTIANVAGKFGYIQVGGFATAFYGAAGGALGALVIQATAADTPLLTVSTVNNWADATILTGIAGGTWKKSILGLAYETPPGAAGLARILMSLDGFVVNVG